MTNDADLTFRVRVVWIYKSGSLNPKPQNCSHNVDNTMNDMEDGSVDDSEEDEDEELWSDMSTASSASSLNSIESIRDRIYATLERNDPNKTSVEATTGWATLCCVRLGSALVGNTSVSDLTLGFHHTSFNRPPPDIGLLLQYLRQGPALRVLKLSGSRPEYTCACLQAVAQHAFIEDLTLDSDIDIPYESLAHLLRTTRSLKKLAMCLDDSSMALAQAFGANETLGIIEFALCNDHHPNQTGQDVFHHLTSHLCEMKLEQLDASVPPTIYSAFNDYLKETQRLTHLTLDGLSFDGEQAALFMDGLLWNQSLSHLTMRSCELDDDANAVFDSAATAAHAASTGSTIKSTMSIVELQVADSCGELSSLLKFMAFKGDNLRVLYLQQFWSIRQPRHNNFWNALLESDTSKIRIRQLRLEGNWEYSLAAIYDCIPRLLYLQELHFDIMRLVLGRSFAVAAQHSGSLQIVSVHGRLPTFSTPHISRIVQASLERNRHLSSVLSMSCSGLTLDRHDDVVAAEASSSPIPNLVAALVHAPRMAPNTLVKGLTAATAAVEAIDSEPATSTK
jgi:hypothetical protein